MEYRTSDKLESHLSLRTMFVHVRTNAHTHTYSAQHLTETLKSSSSSYTCLCMYACILYAYSVRRYVCMNIQCRTPENACCSELEPHLFVCVCVQARIHQRETSNGNVSHQLEQYMYMSICTYTCMYARSIHRALEASHKRHV